MSESNCNNEPVGRVTPARFASCLLTAAALLVGGPALAAEFPASTMQMIIPFDAGGGTDRIGRLVADGIAKNLGVEVRIINMPGNSPTQSHRYILDQRPDGNTLLFTTIGQIVIAPLVEDVGYTAEDFVPVAQVSNPVYALVVKADAPWADFDDMVEAAKQQPGQITIAGGSPASASGFQAVDLMNSTGAEFTMVPTSGASDSVTMVLGGHVASTTRPLGSVVPLVQAGDLKALVTSGVERDPALPDVPTARELGYEHSFGLWRGIMVDADTPPEVVAELEAAVKATLEDPAYIEASSKIGEPPAFVPSAEFKAEIENQLERYKPVMDRALGRN